MNPVSLRHFLLFFFVIHYLIFSKIKKSHEQKMPVAYIFFGAEGEI